MIPAAQYPVIDLGTIGIEYAEVMARPARPLIKPQNNFTPFTQIGDVDSFTYSLDTTWKTRFSKNRATSIQQKNVPTSVSSKIAVKGAQITDFFRKYALLGEQIIVNQAAGTGATYSIPAFDATGATGNMGVSDGVYFVGRYNISNLQYTGSGNAVIVDAANGGVLVTGSTPGGAASMTYDYAAHTGTKTKSGVVLGQALEWAVRGVSNSGQKGVLRILNCPLGPKGDISFVSGSDEFQTMELEGAALPGLDTEGESSQGWWEPLDA